MQKNIFKLSIFDVHLQIIKCFIIIIKLKKNEDLRWNSIKIRTRIRDRNVFQWKPLFSYTLSTSFVLTLLLVCSEKFCSKLLALHKKPDFCIHDNDGLHCKNRIRIYGEFQPCYRLCILLERNICVLMTKVL